MSYCVLRRTSTNSFEAAAGIPNDFAPAMVDGTGDVARFIHGYEIFADAGRSAFYVTGDSLERKAIRKIEGEAAPTTPPLRIAGRNDDAVTSGTPRLPQHSSSRQRSIRVGSSYC